MATTRDTGTVDDFPPYRAVEWIAEMPKPSVLDGLPPRSTGCPDLGRSDPSRAGEANLSAHDSPVSLHLTDYLAPELHKLDEGWHKAATAWPQAAAPMPRRSHVNMPRPDTYSERLYAGHADPAAVLRQRQQMPQSAMRANEMPLMVWSLPDAPSSSAFPGNMAKTDTFSAESTITQEMGSSSELANAALTGELRTSPTSHHLQQPTMTTPRVAPGPYPPTPTSLAQPSAQEMLGDVLRLLGTCASAPAPTTPTTSQNNRQPTPAFTQSSEVSLSTKSVQWPQAVFTHDGVSALRMRGMTVPVKVKAGTKRRAPLDAAPTTRQEDGTAATEIRAMRRPGSKRVRLMVKIPDARPRTPAATKKKKKKKAKQRRPPDAVPATLAEPAVPETRRGVSAPEMLASSLPAGPDDQPVSCPCGATSDDGTGDMIQCEGELCGGVWQHQGCVREALPRNLEEGVYLCEVCDPRRHRGRSASLRRTDGREAS